MTTIDKAAPRSQPLAPGMARHSPCLLTPPAGHAQDGLLEGLEEHSFEFDLALFDTGHGKHPPLPSPPLASQHASSLRP